MSCAFTDALDELGSDIVGGLDAAGNTIAGTVTSALGATESFVSSAAGDVFAAVSGVTNALGSIAANTVTDIEKDAASVVEQAVSTAESAYSSARSAFNTIVSAATPLYNKLESETVPFLQQYGQAIVDSEAEDQFTGASLLVNIAWQAVSRGQLPSTGQLGQIAAQYAAGAEIPGIADALSQYVPQLSALLDGGDLDSAVSTFLTTGSLPSNLQGVLSGASQSVVGQVDQIENAISGAVRTALSSAVAGLGSGASLVTDAAGEIVGLADTAANIAKLTQAQIVSLAGAGIKTITATGDVAIDTAQLLALEAGGMKIVAPAVNLADTTADIATYTATQIGALVAAGVTGLQPSDVQASTGVSTIYDAIVSTGQTYSLVPVQALGTFSNFYIVDLTAGQTPVPFTLPSGDAFARLTATQGGPQGNLDLSSIRGETSLVLLGSGVSTLFGNVANDPQTYSIEVSTSGTGVVQFRDTVGLTADIEQNFFGTLQELTPNAFGTGSITVGNRVEFSSDSTDGNTFSLDGQPTVTLSVDAGLTETLTGSITTSSKAQIFGPAAQSLLVNGGGTLVLTNAADSWTGGTTVDGTTLQLGDGTAASSGASVGSGAVTLDNGASLVFDQTEVQTFANSFGGNGDVVVEGAGTVVLTNTGNAWTGVTTVVGGSTLSIDAASELGTGGLALGDASSAGTLATTNTGTATLGDAVVIDAGGGEIDVTAASGTTVLGDLAGSGPFTKAGAGTLIVGSDNDTGPLSVVGGTLGLILASGAAAGGIALAGDGAASTLSVANTGAVTVAGGLAVGSGGGTVDVASASGVVTIEGALSGQGALTKTGGGTLALAGSGSLNGGITIAGGTLDLASAAALGAGSVTFGSAAATLEIDGTLASGSTFNAALNGVGFGDAIDLRGLAYVAGSSATVSGGTLTVAGGGKSESFTLSAPSLASFSTASDGHGGTLIIDAPATFTDSAGTTHAEASVAAAIAAEVADGGASDQVTLVGGSAGGLQIPGGNLANANAVTGGTSAGIASTGGGGIVNTGSISGTTGISFAGTGGSPVAGAITVSGGGTIIGTQGAGIYARGGSGPVSLGTGGAPLGTVTGTGGNAIDASSTSGDVGIVTGGAVKSTTGTGILAGAAGGGHATVTLGAGTSVQGAATPGSHGAGVAVTASGGGSGTIDVTGTGVTVTGDQPAMSSVTANANATISVTGTGGTFTGSSGLVADQEGSGAFGASVSVADGTTVGFNGVDSTDSYDGQGIFAGNLGPGTTSVTTGTGSVTGNADGIVVAQANGAAGNAVNVITGGDITGEGGASSVPSGYGSLFGGLGQGTTPTGYGVLADDAGTGALNVDTSGGTVRSADADAIEARAAGGKITVTNADAVQHAAGGTGSSAIHAVSSGTGGILVTNAGAIAGTAGTGAFGNGIVALTNASSTSGDVTVNNQSGGTIGAGTAVTGTGISAAVTGTGSGSVTVTEAAAVNAGGAGISATGVGGKVEVDQTGGIIQSGQDGIDASASGGGAVVVSQSGGQIGTSAARVGGAGIKAARTAAGTVAVTAAGVYAAGDGIDAENTGAGAVSVQANGTVSAGGDGISVAGSSAADAVTVASGVTVQGATGLEVDGGTTTLSNAGTIGSTNGGNALKIDAGTLRIGDALGTLNGTIADSGTLALTNASALSLANAVTGSGSVIQSGSGVTTLSASNGYTGGTTLAGGTLVLGNANAIGTTGSIGFTGGTLRYTAANATDYSSRFSGAAGQAYRIDTDGRIVTYATALTSAGGTLAKLGTGTLDLTGTESYTGASTAAAGTLLVDGSDAASTFEVQNGATLGGHGTLGAVTVDAGGFLAPGDSPGQMTVASLALAQGAYVQEQFGGTTPGNGTGHYDQTIVQAGGTVNLGGATLQLSDYGGDLPYGNESFDIIVNGTGQAVEGIFAGLQEGATTTLGGETFAITYKGGTSGNDVVLTEVDQAPTASITTLPYAAVEQTSLSLQDGGLSIADADGGSNNGSETATLTVGEGSLSATAGASGAGVAVSNGGKTATITGTVAQIDALLQGTDGTSTLTYVDDTDTPSATTALTLSANDGALPSNTARTTIAIQAVNDPPTIPAPATYAATEKQALSLQNAGLTVGDPDGLNGTETVTLSVGEGTLAATAGTMGVVVTGQNTGTLVLDGTVSQLDALLQGGPATGGSALTYTDALDAPSASTQLTLTIDDHDNTGSGGPLSAQTTSTLSITGVNQAPTAAVPASGVYQAVEQTALSLKNAGLSIADPDGTGSTETVTLTVGQGVLTATAGNSGATVAAATNGTTALQVTGTVTQIDAFLNGTGAGTSTLIYTDDTDTPSAATVLTLGVRDAGNAIATASTIIAVQAVNDAPTATAATATYQATEQTALNLKGTGLSVGDVDGGTGIETATLSVGEGTLAATAGDSGTTVTGSGTATLTIHGTVAQIGALLGTGGTSMLSYSDGSDTPAASTALTLTIDDGGNTGSGGAKAAQTAAIIDVAAVNHPPVATVPSIAYQAIEQTPLNLKNTGLSVADVDGGTASETATLTVGEGTLSATAGDSGAGVTVSNGGRTVTIKGSTAQIDAVLNGQGTGTLGYVDPLDMPSASTALTLSIDDGGNTGAGPAGGYTTSASQTITVAPVDDAPTAAAPASLGAVERTSLDLAGKGLSVGDVDGGAGIETATLSVGEGTLTAAAGAGASAGLAVSNSGTGVVTLKGTVAQIDALLQGTDTTGRLSYSDNSDTPSANTTLTLSIDDNGNTGAGGAMSAEAQTTIAIQAVNAAPVATAATATYQAVEQTILNLKNTGLLVSDVDGGNGIETATLNVGEGAILADAGNSGAQVSGSGNGSVTITGTLDQIDGVLGGQGTSTLSYVDNSDTPSTSQLTLSIRDNGNTGSGGALTSQAQSTVAIKAVNDAPDATAATATYQAVEKTNLNLKNTGLSVSDVDGGTGIETATLSVGEGLLGATAGDSGASVAGSGSGTLSIRGTTAQIDAVLGGSGSGTLNYVDALNDPSASTALTLTVNDDGNTGIGGALTASSQATIDVESRPDVVSLAPTVVFDGQGTFTFTGFASSAAGIATVEFTAVVHGVEQDLGAAAMNPDGSFIFTDVIGPNLQGSIVATETDDLGQQASTGFSSAIQGGVKGKSFNGQSYVARLDTYDASSGTNTAETYVNRDGSHTVNVLAPKATLDSNASDTFLNHGRGATAFVFSPGYGQDTIDGFQLSGAGHDTIELPSLDFTSLSDVLRHTQNTSAGAVIHDRTSGDTLTIAGITKAQLSQNRSDFTFHA